jgi:hypothetical protein
VTIDCLFSPLWSEWLFGISVIDANMPIDQSTVKRGRQSLQVEMDRKGWDEMNAWMAAGTAIIVIVPFLLLAIASIRYGVDSRPGISERDNRPWLVG